MKIGKINKIISSLLAVLFLINLFPLTTLAASSPADTGAKTGTNATLAAESGEITTENGVVFQLDQSAQNQNRDRNTLINYSTLDKTEKTQIIIKYKDEAGKENAKNKVKNSLKLPKLAVKKQFTRQKLEIVDIGDSDIGKVMKEFQKDSRIEFVQPNYKLNVAIESDTYKGEDSTTTVPGIKLDTYNEMKQERAVGASINITEAWKFTEGSKNVIVGILDSGVSITHKDLAENIYINKREISNNGIDDDNNGYIDDVSGWDFVNNDNNVEDSEVGIHGTHMAGIIGASRDNRGIAGISPKVQILPLKFMKNNFGYTSDAIEAINYAESLGVDIINCSWGSYYYNPALKDAMKNSKLLFVCAAGNNNRNVMATPTYPACFDLPNVISVAASDDSGNLTDFSNYGDEVDVAAPGIDILSTIPGNCYQRFSGSSVSAAFVTGVSALLKSYRPDITNFDIISTIEKNSNSSKAIDAAKAMSNIQTGCVPKEFCNDPTIDEIAVVDNLNETMSPSVVNKFNYNKYETGQFTKNIGEDIQKSSGSLSINQSLLKLKGRNGLDLDLNVLYDSKNAGLYNPSYNLVEKYYFNYYVFKYYSMYGVTNIREMPQGCGPLKDARTEKYDGFTNVGSAFNQYDWYIELWNNSGDSSDKPPYLYIVEEYISYGDIYAYYSDSTNVREDTTYNEKTANIGAGWNWGFSSIENANGARYLHLSNGASYKIEMTAIAGDSNLKDYTLKDLRVEYDGSYMDGAITSAYALFYKDGKREYFSNDGKLLAIMDRFDNKIKFEYETGQLYRITDTTGRTITFIYNTGTSTKTVTITLSDPEASSIIITSEKIPNYSNDYVLKSIRDLEQRTTSFNYRYDTANFNFFTRENAGIIPGINVYANLETIAYPTAAATSYTYEKTTGNLSNKGMEEYYRIKTRKDNTSGKDYTIRTFNYSSNNYTGYPAYTDPGSLPGDFTYTTTVMDGNSNTTAYTYNNKHLLKNEQWKENGINLRKDTEYSYDTNKLPAAVTVKSYNNNGQYMKADKNYQYNDFGDLMASWSPMAQGDTNNTEYKTSYDYNSTYHYLINKTYKKDQNTTIQVINVPYATDQKKIEYSQIFENGIKKNQSQFIYDAYGNIIEERMYKDGFMDFISNFYSYDDTDNTRQVKLNGVYRTKKWTKDIVDADGITIAAIGTIPEGVIEETSVFDWFGNVVLSKDGNSNTKKYQYDKLGRVKRETNADETYKEWLYTENAQENSVVITDENYNSSQYSAAGSMVKLIYDGLGKLMYEQRYDKNPASGIDEFINIRGYTYDNEYRIRWEDNFESNNSLKSYTIYSYYPDGRLRGKTLTQNSGQIWLYQESIQYDDAYDNGQYLKTTKVVSGNTTSPAITTTTYTDNMDRLRKQGKIHNGTEYADTFEYDYIGNKVKEKLARAYMEPALYATNDFTTLNEYDYAGNLIKSTNNNGKFMTKQYDALGRLVNSTDYNANTSSPAMYSSTYVYDNLGRLIKEILPFGFNETTGASYSTIKLHYYDRNSNIVSEKVSNNKAGESLTFSKTDYSYNAVNRLEKVTVYYNGEKNITQYYYDASGNKVRMYTGLVSELEINGLDVVVPSADNEYSLTKYEFGRFNNLKSMTDSSQKTEYYSYDLNGNLTSKTDRNGAITTYTYDGMNRELTRSVVTAGHKGDKAYVFTYSKNGKMESMSDSANLLTNYLYDDLGRLIQEQTGNISKIYDYDSANNRILFKLTKDGKTKINTTYQYDNLNRLNQVLENNQLTASYTYDDNGNRRTLFYANGNNTSYTYNRANKVDTIINKKDTTPLSGYAYEYSLDGNLIKKIIGGKVTDYVYDGLGRLKTEAVTGEDTVTYTYDDYSNRETMTFGSIVTSYHYENGRLVTETRVDGNTTEITSFVYDNNGNQIYREVETIKPQISGEAEKFFAASIDQNALNKTFTINEFDGFNQLVKVSTNTANTEYAYSPDGLRISKTVNDVTTKQIWDGDQIALELDNVGEATKYIRGINLIAAEDGSMVRKYYLFNGHGDIIQLTDTLGSVIKDYDYDAFGNEKNPASEDSNVFRYCGEYFDRETNTYYLRARYYDPEIGRFISEDSIWGSDDDPLSLNLYTYCANNPIMFYDPTGHYSEVMQQYNALEEFFRHIVTGGTAIVSTILAPEVIITVGVAGLGVATIAYVSSPDYYETGMHSDTFNLAGAGVSYVIPGTNRQSDIVGVPFTIQEAKKNKSPDKGNKNDSGKKAKDAGKNDPHGDNGRAMEKAQKQIKDLQDKLKDAKTRKEKDDIKKTIENVRKAAERAKKGETHHTK